jgi:hypothetical protein
VGHAELRSTPQTTRVLRHGCETTVIRPPKKAVAQGRVQAPQSSAPHVSNPSQAKPSIRAICPAYLRMQMEEIEMMMVRPIRFGLIRTNRPVGSVCGVSSPLKSIKPISPAEDRGQARAQGRERATEARGRAQGRDPVIPPPPSADGVGLRSVRPRSAGCAANLIVTSVLGAMNRPCQNS